MPVCRLRSVCERTMYALRVHAPGTLALRSVRACFSLHGRRLRRACGGSLCLDSMDMLASPVFAGPGAGGLCQTVAFRAGQGGLGRARRLAGWLAGGRAGRDATLQDGEPARPLTDGGTKSAYRPAYPLSFLHTTSLSLILSHRATFPQLFPLKPSHPPHQPSPPPPPASR